ncbi:MAG: crotonase/enoyl-CoA hydratase family protein [Mycobacterium sp.]
MSATNSPHCHGEAKWSSFSVLIDDGVAEVCIDTGTTGNLLGIDFWRELPVLFRQLDSDPRVNAVLVSAAGQHFSYGIDLNVMTELFGEVFSEGGMAAARTDFLCAIREVQAAVSAVAQCCKPVIVESHGWCIGAAVDFIAAADIRYASSDARFSVREIKVGIVADLGSLQRLPTIIGDAHLRELAFTGDDIDAGRACRIGLVNDVLSDRSAALEHARATARRIARNAPLPVQGVKQILEGARRPVVEEGLRHVATWNSAFLPSADLNEAISAVLEKRQPHFMGQ